MGLLDFPNPVGWFESVKDEDQKRDIINAVLSATYSAWIAFVWRSGSSKIAQWFGEGQALQDSAIAMYLTLRTLEKKNLLTLTLPKDMLNPDLLSKFQTEEMTK